MMVRAIQLSDSTYAALWAKWEEGDDGEEGVIRKLLGLKDKPVAAAPAEGQGKGLTDARFGVFFPEGFEIFRVFKGREVKAVVRDGIWFNITTNRVATSLNQLSAHIGAPTENAWRGWYYKKGEKSLLIDTLRDRNKVGRRSPIKWT